MEKSIREEIRQEFNNDIIEYKAQIKKQKDDFEAFKCTIELELSEQVAKEISNCDDELKKLEKKRSLNNALGVRTQRIETSENKSSSQAPENVARILHMTKQFRKQKLYHAFSTVVIQEKHDKEVA